MRTSLLWRGAVSVVARRSWLVLSLFELTFQCCTYVVVYIKPVELQKRSVQLIHKMVLIAGEEQGNVTDPIPMEFDASL